VPMGVSLRAVIEEIGGGLRPGRTVKAVLQGVSSGVVPAERLDTPLTHEAMAAIGSGVGSAGFVVFDETADMVGVAAGVSRFLAVESCGQCTPCKQDGLGLAERLADLCTGGGGGHEMTMVRGLLDHVSDGARCYLALQHQAVVSSLMARFEPEFVDHALGRAETIVPYEVAELVDVKDEVAWLDERQATKQPDWSYGDGISGQTPVDRLSGTRSAP
jgi:NADH-quinone oxidoreductase subunit F